MTLARSITGALAARSRRRRVWDSIAHPRLGYFAPLPPAPTGVATYSAAVLAGLRRIGFLDRRRVDVAWPIEPKHEGLVPWYQLGIYHVGNNLEFHQDIYRFACRQPGLVVLHDLALDDFVRGLKVSGDANGFIAEREAARLRSRLDGSRLPVDEPLRDPWCGQVVRSSRGLIVHSDFCRRYLDGIGCRTPVFVVPHPVVETEEAMRAAALRRDELRARIDVRDGDVLVVAAGDLNGAKQLEAVLAAVAHLEASVKVALVGRRIRGVDVERMVDAARLGARAALLADVSDADFRGWLFAADVVTDLRHPHRGEVSGSLARAMQAGRPTIVSATGTYLDVPDDLVRRVAAGPTDPHELAVAIRTLAEDPDQRARIGAAAADHVRRLRESEATARGYEEAIEHTLALVRDPARAAAARWAGSLADVGVDESLLARGYGLSYARALASFAQTSENL